MAAIKQFSYDPSLPSDLDWVRYHLGDLDEDRAEVDDREIMAELAAEPEPEPETGADEPTAAQWRAYRCTVAARLAEHIAAAYAGETDVDFADQAVKRSGKFLEYKQLAAQLRATARGASPLKVIRV